MVKTEEGPLVCVGCGSVNVIEVRSDERGYRLFECLVCGLQRWLNPNQQPTSVYFVGVSNERSP